MTRFGHVLAMIGVLALGVIIRPPAAQAQFPFTGAFAFYDDFSSLLLDWTRWVPGEQTAGGAATPNTDTFRGIVQTKSGPQAQIQLHSWGHQGAGNLGRSGFGQQRLDFRNSNEISTIIAQITVIKATAVGCNANPSTTQTGAMILGNFFNTSTSGPPTDQTGDAYAGIQLLQDNAQPRLVGFLRSCDNATCSTLTDLINPVVFTTTWKAGQPRYYGIQWDPDNDKFIVAVMDLNFNNIETQELNYSGFASDTEVLFLHRKSLLVNNATANCQPPGKRTEANMTAVFDNVYVNQ